MESFTNITPLDQFLIQRAKELDVPAITVTRVRDFPIFDELTGLVEGKANQIVDESASGDEILLVYGYEIWGPSGLTVRLDLNNETIITSDKLKYDFEEPYVVEPGKKVEIFESHVAGTIPLKVNVKTTAYRIAQLETLGVA